MSLASKMSADKIKSIEKRVLVNFQESNTGLAMNGQKQLLVLVNLLLK